VLAKISVDSCSRNEVPDHSNVAGRVGFGHQFARQPFVCVGDLGFADGDVDVAADVDLPDLTGSAAGQELADLGRVADRRRQTDPLDLSCEIL